MICIEKDYAKIVDEYAWKGVYNTDIMDISKNLVQDYENRKNNQDSTINNLSIMLQRRDEQIKDYRHLLDKQAMLAEGYKSNNSNLQLRLMQKEEQNAKLKKFKNTVLALTGSVAVGAALFLFL